MLLLLPLAVAFPRRAFYECAPIPDDNSYGVYAAGHQAELREPYYVPSQEVLPGRRRVPDEAPTESTGLCVTSLEKLLVEPAHVIFFTFFNCILPAWKDGWLARPTLLPDDRSTQCELRLLIKVKQKIKANSCFLFRNAKG